MIRDRDTEMACNGLRRFRVTVKRQDVEDFRRVVSRDTGIDDGNKLTVPLTFPATWFGLKDVRNHIKGSVGDLNQSALFHLDQTIEMLGRLEVGQTYYLDLQMGKLGCDGKLKVSAQVRTFQEVTLVKMNSLFAVVSAQGLWQ